jgi:glycosyltransferase involved in cell wall biosynthesis
VRTVAWKDKEDVMRADRDRRSILMDARVNAVPGGQGLARWVLKMIEHMGPLQDGLALRVLVNRSRPQLFPLAGASERAELIDTDIVLPTSASGGREMRSRELGRLIHDLDAAVFYSPYPLFAPRICPCPLVMTIHDCIFESGSAKDAGGWHMRFLLKAVTAARLRQAAAVVTPSRASLAEIRRHYPAAPRPTVIPCGIDDGQFTGVTDDAVKAVRERYDLPERFILAVGTHRRHKNHGILVRALALMPPTVSLVIVGYCEPEFRDPLERQIPDLGLQARVRLLPAVPDEDLPAVYRAASVFAFPSLVEGYGIPPLEAMSAGVPVVASAIPVVEEVHGSAAMLVPPHDATAWATAIMSVLDDPATASHMVVKGTAAATAATWHRSAQALRELLLSVIEGSGSVN